jgi:hypothetical protein
VRAQAGGDHVKDMDSAFIAIVEKARKDNRKADTGAGAAS